MLKPQEVAEISLALWYLPLGNLAEVRALVMKRKAECGYDEPVDDSDEWTEQDLRDFSADSFRRLEEKYPYDWEEIPGGEETPP
jgi:hypothetical protein